MIQCRHRLASGSLSEMWEFDPSRGVLDIVLRQASADPIAFTIAVCAPDRPRVGAFPILRADSESWHVLPACFRFEGEALVPVNAAIHPSFGPGLQLLLTHAPADVDAELTAL